MDWKVVLIFILATISLYFVPGMSVYLIPLIFLIFTVLVVKSMPPLFSDVELPKQGYYPKPGELKNALKSVLEEAVSKYKSVEESIVTAVKGKEEKKEEKEKFVPPPWFGATLPKDYIKESVKKLEELSKDDDSSKGSS